MKIQTFEEFLNEESNSLIKISTFSSCEVYLDKVKRICINTLEYDGPSDENPNGDDEDIELANSAIRSLYNVGIEEEYSYYSMKHDKKPSDLLEVIYKIEKIDRLHKWYRDESDDLDFLHDFIIFSLKKYYRDINYMRFDNLYKILPQEEQRQLRKYKLINKYKNVI